MPLNPRVTLDYTTIPHKGYDEDAGSALTYINSKNPQSQQFIGLFSEALSN